MENGETTVLNNDCQYELDPEDDKNDNNVVSKDDNVQTDETENGNDNTTNPNASPSDDNHHQHQGLISTKISRLVAEQWKQLLSWLGTNVSGNNQILLLIQQLRQRTKSPQVQRQIWIGLALTILSLVGYRNRKHIVEAIMSLALPQRRRSLAATTRTTSTTMRTNTDEENNTNYRQLALEAPLSTLLRAISHGNVKQALVGSQVVYYFLKNDNNHNTTIKARSGGGDRVVLSTTTTASTTATTNPGEGGGWKLSRLPAHNSQMHTHVLEKLTSPSAMTDVSLLPESPSLLSQLSTPFLASLPFVYLALLYRMMQNLHEQQQQQHKDGSFLNPDNQSSNKTSTSTTFADVGGLDSILTELKQVVDYCQYPERFQACGARPPRGILLHGRSGTGKTLLAKALAGEASLVSSTSPNNKNYTSSAATAAAIDSFTVCSASEFVEVYVGRGAARVRSLFASARKRAWQNYQRKLHGQNSSFWLSPSFWWRRSGSTPNHSAATVALRKPTALIFIDELDAVAKTRSSSSSLSLLGGSNDEREQTLNQLLTEMDGFSNNNGNHDVLVIVLAATNRIQVLDPAVLRRFERQLHVECPTLEGRCEILQIHARNLLAQHQQLQQQEGNGSNNNSSNKETTIRPTTVSQPTIDWKRLAQKCQGMTGADLRTVVNDATLLALRTSPASSTITTEQHEESGNERVAASHHQVVVTMEHFERAIDRLQQSKKQSRQELFT
ncbi:hypothetical protein ACA910_020062 [Epithemia clementina (nom. ined.)]